MKLIFLLFFIYTYTYNILKFCCIIKSFLKSTALLILNLTNNITNSFPMRLVKNMSHNFTFDLWMLSINLISIELSWSSFGCLYWTIAPCRSYCSYLRENWFLLLLACWFGLGGVPRSSTKHGWHKPCFITISLHFFNL